MGKIIAIANQKGGVGKTTTAINLSSSLAILNNKVLLIDADPQGNTSQGLGYTKNNIDFGTLDFIEQTKPASSCIKTVNEQNSFSIIPTKINLAQFETKRKNEINIYKFSDVLKPIKNNYDYIVIDCPPSLGVLLLNILTVSDSILIPVQCEFFAFEGLKKIFRTFKTVRKKYNENLDIEGILLTMYNPNQNMDTNVKKQIEEYFEPLLLNTIIYRDTKLSEAPSHGKSIYDYKNTSKGATNYLDLANEIIIKNTEMSDKRKNLGKSLSEILKEDSIADIDFIVNLGNNDKNKKPKDNKPTPKKTVEKQKSNTTKKNSYTNKYSKLIGLDKNEISKNLGLTYNDLHSNIWMYRITDSFSFLKKNYVYIFFRNSVVVAVELKKFKLNDEKSKLLLDKHTNSISEF